MGSWGPPFPVCLSSERLSGSLGHQPALTGAWSYKHTPTRLGVTLSADAEIEHVAVTFGFRDP